MARKDIWTPAGWQWVEIDMDLGGFQVGDIITRDEQYSPDCNWKGEKIVVQGESVSGSDSKKLWGRRDEGTHAVCTDDLNGLLLLERPGLKFKVGDRVQHEQFGLGTVIVLDPNSPGVPYLVEFDNSYAYLNDAENSWIHPWYPENHKTSDDVRAWILESRLTHQTEETTADNIITERDGKKFVFIKMLEREREIVTEGSLWEFFQGDIITLDPGKAGGGPWRGEKICVVGFSPAHQRMLYGCYADGKDAGEVRYVSTAASLILLERPGDEYPGLKFRVGDRVRCTADNQGGKGTVVALDPGHIVSAVLVDFEEEIPDYDGNDHHRDWNRPWYPEPLRNHNPNRAWRRVEDLAFESNSAVESEEDPEKERELSYELHRVRAKGRDQETEIAELKVQRQEAQDEVVKTGALLAMIETAQKMHEEILSLDKLGTGSSQDDKDSADFPLFVPEGLGYKVSEQQATSTLSVALQAIAVWIYHQLKGESEWNRPFRYPKADCYEKFQDEQVGADFLNLLLQDDHGLSVERVAEGLQDMQKEVEEDAQAAVVQFGEVEQELGEAEGDLDRTHDQAKMIEQQIETLKTGGAK